MEIKKLLPIGSVVQLDGEKKVMIMGIKVKNFKTNVLYDYMAVLYPEGYIGNTGYFFFNHDLIQEVVFEGYKDEERKQFLKNLENYYKKIEESDQKHE